MLELAAFLGNHGREYSRTRHNAGFLLAEKEPFRAALSWQKKFRGLYAAIDREQLGERLPGVLSSGAGPDVAPRLHFVKPETYMNRSGESVAAAASFFKIKSESILVVHDELELPLGTISLKFSGGLGGHNGLRSMKACFGTADFWRIRVGIGRPDSRLPGEGGPKGSGEGIVDWVLSDFSAAELETLDEVLETGAELLARAFLDGPETLLPEWSKMAITKTKT
ncbi:MAG: aminoacyl-tRNA hydrolase [Treponema sp.]|nr:aminoacyl-tRNA hydrolase [Treponema sp.]